MMMSCSQVSYAMFISMALSSHQLNQEKLRHFRNMIVENEEGGVLASKSVEDEALAEELKAESKVDAVEASTLEEEANGLDVLSKKDASLAEKDEVEAGGLQAEAVDASAQASKRTAEAVAEEAFVVEEREKAAVEALEAQGSTDIASADEVGIGLCEFIPFIDVFCNVVGGAVAIGEETAASLELSQSVLDYTTAHETEVQEEKDIVTASVLRKKGQEFTTKAEETLVQAEREKAKSIEEHTLATEKHSQATTEMTKSQQEQALSEEKEVQSTQEKAKSTQRFKDALTEAFHAFLYSIWSLFLSFLVLIFFSIRIIGTILLPTIHTITHSTIVTNAFSSSSSYNNDNESRNCMMVLFHHSSYQPFRRKIHYVLLHVKVYVLTMFLTLDKFPTITSSSEEDVVANITTLSKGCGEVILFFVLIAATMEATIVHFLPHVWKNRSSSDNNGNCICHVCKSIVFVFAHAFLFLFVLFTLETIILSLLYGQLIFIHKNSNNQSIQICQYIILILFVISSAYWFVNETKHSPELKTANKGQEEELIVDTVGESSSLIQNDTKCVSYHNTSTENLVEIDIEKDKEEDDVQLLSKVSQNESLLQMTNLQYIFESTILIYMSVIILTSILPTIHLFQQLRR